MEKRVAVLRGSSRYDVLGIFADIVAKQLEVLGCDVDEINISENTIESLGNSISAADYIFTYNLMGTLIGKQLIENTQYHDVVKSKPFVSYLVDHPMYHYYRLNFAQDYQCRIATFDRENTKYLKNRYSTSVEKAEFLPCFGLTAKKQYDFSEKDIDLLFVGSYSKSVSKEIYFADTKPELRQFIYGLCDLMIAEPDLTMENALIKYMIQLGIEDYKDNELLKYYMATFSNVDSYIRTYYRDKLIAILLNNGIEISVYGSGWEEYDGPNKEKVHILHTDNGNLLEGIELMARAKAIVGMIPWFKDGIQDRILNTLCNNAVCITDATPYLRENFVDEESIIFYNIKEIEQLPNKIRTLFSDEEKMSKIAANGKRIAEERYSQEIFAKKILDLMTEEANK